MAKYINDAWYHQTTVDNITFIVMVRRNRYYAFCATTAGQLEYESFSFLKRKIMRRKAISQVKKQINN